MAKCVKSKLTGDIMRLSDDKAAKLVAGKEFVYSPKSEYRQFLKQMEELDA